MRRIGSLFAVVAMLAVPATASAAEDWSYLEPGDLPAGSGQGLNDTTVYAPGMRFPIENGPAYPNSQVWGVGGSQGPGGSQCDAANYSYPWRDNYCETRSWDMPLCPAGVGHQGQDIRPATCEDSAYWNVASEAGTITNIGSYSVYVTAPDGTRFDYLHGSQVAVSVGQAVDKAQHVSKVSNEFGGTSTTIHLHFNIKQDVGGVGFVYVSPYMSLVTSYEELMGFGNEPPGGPLDAVDCSSIRGWAQDPDVPDDPVTVEVWFGGPAGDPQATGVTIVADEHREDLCNALGSCNHGFALEIPMSLRDGQSHDVFVYAVDDDGGESPQLEASPGQLQCAAVPPPDGVRRKVASPEMIAAWGLSTFWDLAKLDTTDLEAIPVGTSWPDERLVVMAESDQTLWVIDNGLRREVDAAAAEAWGIAAGDALVWPDDSVDNVPLGPPMRSQVFLVSANGEGIYVMDDAICPPNEPGCDGDGMGGGTTGDDGGGSGSGSDDGSYPWDDPNADGDGGCGCRNTNPDLGAAALLGLVVLARRRRG